MSNKSIVGIFAILGFSLIGSSSAPALAGTTVAPPIGTCVQGGSTGSIFYAWEGLLNIHPTEKLGIDCGVPFTTRGVEQRVVQVQVLDRSTAQKVACTMRAFDVYGTIVFDGGTQYSGATNSATGVTSMPWILPTGLATHTAYVACTIPPEQDAPSGILGIISAG